MGKYDKNQHEFHYENVYSLDDGLDFYAPQTMLAADGRRIMIGWMQSWDSNIRPVGQKWSCMMTLPRELRIENGKILQSPVREIEKYHSNPVCYERKEISGICQLEGIRGRVLDMTVEEALEFFKNIPRIKQKIQTLHDVGLGYIKLGQPSTTLSGGEAQRVKLATELSKKPTGKTLYILDEPTTGLHIADVHKLVEILQRLVDTGNSIIVIEHNLDLIKTSDYIIDLGPEGGDKGGKIVAVGTPEQIARNEQSYTGQFLGKYLI